MKQFRKQYLLDKPFQYGMSIRAAILPLITILIISAVLLYFSNQNNNYIMENNSTIKEIVGTQNDMIDMFLETPALHNSTNPVIKNGRQTFQDNIGKLRIIMKRSQIIVKNSQLLLYILIIMTVIQTVIIFAISIFFTHKVSGPIYVMAQFLKRIREGKEPDFRPLRKKDELQEFYKELQETIDYIKQNK